MDSLKLVNGAGASSCYAAFRVAGKLEAGTGSDERHCMHREYARKVGDQERSDNLYAGDFEAIATAINCLLWQNL